MLKFDLKYTKYVVAGLVATAVAIKHKWAYNAAIAIASWFTVYYAGLMVYFMAVGMVALTDIVTGVWASIKKGEKFSSKKFGKGMIQKTVVYFLIMQASFEVGKVLQHAIAHETLWLTWALALLILLYELSSIIENVIVINPNMVFLRRFSGLFEKVVDKQLDNVSTTLGSAEEEKEEKQEGVITEEPQ